jgi:hypothetical protein
LFASGTRGRKASYARVRFGGWTDAPIFFHFVSKEDFIPDYEGVALPNLKAAHQHAMRLVGHTIAALADEDLRLWMIEIADERQCVVLTVLFPLTPPPKGPGPAHPTLPGPASSGATRLVRAEAREGSAQTNSRSFLSSSPLYISATYSP